MKVNQEELILSLYDKKMIEFGDFVLKSGKLSHVYVDVRKSISYPNIYKLICDMMYQVIEKLNYDYICGVPYSALTFASSIAYAYDIPMLLKRKEAKEYGTKKIIEGAYEADQKVVIIEDIITTGMSILETTGVLEDNKLVITDICVLVDRNQGGIKILNGMGYNVHSIMNLNNIIEVLYANNKISLAEKTKALSSIEKQ